MKRPPSLLTPGPLELLEDAIRLLRAHAGVVAVHVTGSVPFAIALLYFWADMSRGAFAADRCAAAAGLLAVLFLCMKAAHAVFGAELLARISHTPRLPWTGRRLYRVLTVQAAVQPLGLLLLPAPLIGALSPALAVRIHALSILTLLAGMFLGLAVGWSYAFFQAATILADRADGVARHCFQAAWRHARLWPVQNHVALGLLGLFGLFVFLNAVIGIIALPTAAKLLFGIESSFTLSQATLFNTTFFFTACLLAWLILDPVAKAFYALRVFHGEAIASGADLRAELRRLRAPRTGWIPVVLLLGLGCLGFERTQAATESAPPPAPPSAAVTTSNLDPELGRAIDEVLTRRAYTWREHRDRPSNAAAPEDWLSRAMKSFVDSLEEILRQVSRAIFRFLDWLILRRLRVRGSTADTGMFDWTAGLDLVLYTLLALGIGLLIYQAVRAWRRRTPPVTVEAVPSVALPDLRDENVGAEQLPEEGWLQMARDLAERGEHRLALRALYLAGLAGLARRELLTLARHKSNREYARELERRARKEPELPLVFAHLVAVFDRAWYGTLAVTPLTISDFETGVRQMVGPPTRPGGQA